MIPTREEAHRLLTEGEGCNPGPWGDHSRNVALCAQRIADAAGMDGKKAYVLGLLHDIGRKFGKGHLQHVWYGYQYMSELGYDTAARICLTHSFNLKSMEEYIGKRDVPESQQQEIQDMLDGLEYDDYDRLIQLCDSLAMAEGVADIETRMLDVKTRYGWCPQKKWDANMALKAYFEEKCGKSIYDVVK